MLDNDQQKRLANIINWIRTAKECLPAINEGESHLRGPGQPCLGVDRVAEMSALLDRLYGSAVALSAGTVPTAAARRHRAA